MKQICNPGGSSCGKIAEIVHISTVENNVNC